MQPPLADLVVLDLSDEPVALAARLLADLGAEVIRVEPSGGDAMRQAPPFVDGVPGVERSLAHIAYNAGKKSLALDFETPRAWEVIARLARRAKLVGPKVHDARIAAICLSHGVDVLFTADRDFSHFPDLKTRNPLL